MTFYILPNQTVIQRPPGLNIMFDVAMHILSFGAFYLIKPNSLDAWLLRLYMSERYMTGLGNTTPHPSLWSPHISLSCHILLILSFITHLSS